MTPYQDINFQQLASQPKLISGGDNQKTFQASSYDSNDPRREAFGVFDSWEVAFGIQTYSTRFVTHKHKGQP